MSAVASGLVILLKLWEFIKKLWDLIKRLLPVLTDPTIPKWLRWIVCLIALLLAAYLSVCWAELYHTCWFWEDRYGFEDTSNPGWVVSDDNERGAALSGVGISTAYKVNGNSSMSVHVVLDGTEEGRKKHLHQGEVFVDPTVIRPCGYSKHSLPYVDLSHKTIKASVLLPSTLVGKDPDNPIVVYLFVEGCAPRITRFDLNWRNVTMAGRFDLMAEENVALNQLCRIGIKLGLNEKDHNAYSGDIYIDAINW